MFVWRFIAAMPYVEVTEERIVRAQAARPQRRRLPLVATERRSVVKMSTTKWGRTLLQLEMGYVPIYCAALMRAVSTSTNRHGCERKLSFLYPTIHGLAIVFSMR